VTVAVLGPGGVGGFVSAALARAGVETVVVARQALDRISVDSVRLGRFVAHPRVVTELEEAVDVLIVATKATTLEAALERVRGEAAAVLPLLNGLDHVTVLRERFGDRVIPAAIRIESERVAPGRIVQTSPFLVVEMTRAHPIAAALERAGIPTAVEPDALWRKLVRLNALALTTSAFDAPIGEIRMRERAILERCAREGAAVAAAEGAPVAADDVLAELDAAHATLSSSMARDIDAGAKPELDAIAGGVLRAARRHGVDCPTITSLAARVAERAGVPAP
jgi:2-dehydropantoate 2-reductase